MSVSKDPSSASGEGGTVEDLLVLLEHHTPRLPLRIVHDTLDGPLDPEDGARVVDIAYENGVVWVVTRNG